MRQKEIFLKSMGRISRERNLLAQRCAGTPVSAAHCHSTTCLTRTGPEENDPAQESKSYVFIVFNTSPQTQEVLD